MIVPADRGPEPEPAVPSAPIIRRSRDKETPTATQPFLLRTAHDERLFKYYTTAQLAIVAPAARRARSARRRCISITGSAPTASTILRETLEDPFSYLVGVQRRSAGGWR